MRVRRSTLICAILGGAGTLEALQAATRAGMGCGTCRIDLLELLGDGREIENTSCTPVPFACREATRICGGMV
jgi:NAD(P)H-nitrite reductase large subunit